MKAFLNKYKKEEVLEYKNLTNDQEPLVSIIVISYNHRLYIKNCLDNIISQDVKFNIEILIGDDDSGDGTKEICKEYSEKFPSKIKLFLHSRRNNISINNKPTGRFNYIYNLSQARGKYIAICEGDDYWTDPLKLQKQVDFLENNNNYVLCFHKVKILNPDGSLSDDFITKVPENHESIETLLEHGNYIHTPSIVYRNVIKSIPFEFMEVVFGDYFLYTMLAEKGLFKYIEVDMAVYRSGVGVISKMDNKDQLLSYIKQFSCMISYLKDENLKKILMERQVAITRSYYYLVEDKYYEIKDQYDQAFVSKKPIFMQLKKIQNYYWKLKNIK